ncbi:uncharacterized protein TrAFT101_004359 [Trichoderma asperellum]|uniref:Aminoglycoside phosphotransferase domain-containing protein n=1 Tax=Trichoderma asperellum (strain ATCC 204424 / CBS 433.97 / NBRC 101777) TaxID=1042311 RepID=A0A2T3ZMY8_TRIA4|nr:hypothetical protein M441DRAFT_42007 [Trichoderma asperellum CBS 433.97]PTB46164.1 hypothetical protein M441DRAFT_42007 [Trichoderma asperellum CBS 433.97]UKZ88609.1 hypothetical protein TrAFT101_004359 [Trichoderma asperellum]
MESTLGPRETTLETHPTQGISFSRETIVSIIDFLVPGCRILAIDALEHGRSFNNRIYFLKVYIPDDLLLHSLNNGAVNDLVLKLNGKFFDYTKSKNEVSCLSLLEHFVPEIPSPKVLAWSDSKNSIVHKLTATGNLATKEFEINSEGDGKVQGWILMTRLPGVPLSTLNLNTDKLKVVGEQLADIVYRWRESLPAWASAGNLECEISHEEEKALNSLEVPGLRIASSSYMPGFGVKVVEPIISQLQYYQVKLETRLQKLQEFDIFSGNRHLIAPIKEFIAIQLPQLGISSGESRFLFTHYDLSPRNVLVSADHTKITGIIDFEFSGFFPELDEFVNDSVANEGDWPDAFYEAYLSRLEVCGMKTPRKGIKDQYWREATSLSRLEDNVAPWWLENLAPEDKNQYSEDLRKSGKTVLETIQLFGTGL